MSKNSTSDNLNSDIMAGINAVRGDISDLKGDIADIKGRLDQVERHIRMLDNAQKDFRYFSIPSDGFGKIDAGACRRTLTGDSLLQWEEDLTTTPKYI